MKFKKISTKMLCFILPVIILAMVMLTMISFNASGEIVQTEMKNHMSAELESKLARVEQHLNGVKNTATTLSSMVGSTYQVTKLSVYETMLKKLVSNDEVIVGSGIWFEPYGYDSKQKYMGPYAARIDTGIEITYDYSTEEYDYFSLPFYQNAKNLEEATITEPYYDPTTQRMMCTCSMPIYSNNNIFMGCITVDIALESIQQIVDEIKIGSTGSAMLIGPDGTYYAGVDTAKIEGEISIIQDENVSLAKAGEWMLQNESGQTTYEREGEGYNVYYSTLDHLGWKLVIQVAQSELNQPVTQLVSKMIIVCVIAILCCIAVVFISVKYIAKNLKKVVRFATSLAQGDFTVNQLHIKSQDELGRMGESLNEMYGENKEVIVNIAEHAIDMEISSGHLYDSAKELLHQFHNIENYIGQVNEAMMSTSAATEEVNASAEEVNSSVTLLAAEIGKTKEMADEISNRADRVGKSSQDSFINAEEMSATFQRNLEKSIENAKVVEGIESLANAISGIASQINLLSLNASIEAARAGEHGRGFSVVATEIGQLANATTDTVGKIQTTVTSVKSAFSQLTKESVALLKFVQDTVTPDYGQFVTIAKQYHKDAKAIDQNAVTIVEMAQNISMIMGEVNAAIQNISESAQVTADNSAKVLQSVEEVSEEVGKVTEMSKDQESIADNLQSVVRKFKLSE